MRERGRTEREGKRERERIRKDGERKGGNGGERRKK